MKWGPVALTPAARMLHQQRGCSNSSEDAPGAVRMLHGQGGLSKSTEDAPRAVRMLHQHHLRMQLRSHVVLAVFGVALPPHSSFIGLKVIQTLSQGQILLLASHPGCQIPPKRGRERASSLLGVSISDGPGTFLYKMQPNPRCSWLNLWIKIILRSQALKGSGEQLGRTDMP